MLYASLSTLLRFLRVSRSFRLADIILINAHQLSWQVLTMRQQAAVSRYVPLHLSLLLSIPPFPSVPTINPVVCWRPVHKWMGGARRLKMLGGELHPSSRLHITWRRAPPTICSG